MIHSCKKQNIDAKVYTTCIFNPALDGALESIWGKDRTWLKYLRTTRARKTSPSLTSSPSANTLP